MLPREKRLVASYLMRNHQTRHAQTASLAAKVSPKASTSELQNAIAKCLVNLGMRLDPLLGAFPDFCQLGW